MKPLAHDPQVIERMQMAFELYEVAEAMKRQNIRRRYPNLGEAEIEERVLAWLNSRPGVEDGDGDRASFIRREPPE